MTNVWIPDGYKDVTIDRKAPRERLRKSLDEMFAEPIDPAYNLDAVEAKLFGIGSETYVVGSHEFYLGYAVETGKLLCLDAGHFHPTETIADKISSVLLYLDEILLHVSRGIRWDSDHVVILNDDLRAIAEEIVRGGFLERVHIGLDFFDASINRVAAWVIGTRAMIKALLVGPAGADGQAPRGGERGRLHGPAGGAGGAQDAAAGRGLGLLLPEAERAGVHVVDGRGEALRGRGDGEEGLGQSESGSRAPCPPFSRGTCDAHLVVSRSLTVIAIIATVRLERIAMNPVLGVLLYVSAGRPGPVSTCPSRACGSWAWESYWMVYTRGGLLIVPVGAGLLACRPTCSRCSATTPWDTLGLCFLFGAMWGAGGLTWGLMIRYLGVGLGVAIGCGLCAAVGTLVPPLFLGEFQELVDQPAASPP